MKRIIVFSFVITLIFAGCSSDPLVNNAFGKYSGRDGIISITVPGFAVHMLTWFAELTPEEEKLLDKIDLVKILAVDDDTKYKKLNFYREFSRMIDSDYQQLLSIKDGKDDVQILAKMKSEEDITDLLIIVGGSDNAVVYVKGNFNMTEIANETDLLKGKGWKGVIK